jgi:hypothetical protein
VAEQVSVFSTFRLQMQEFFMRFGSFVILARGRGEGRIA